MPAEVLLRQSLDLEQLRSPEEALQPVLPHVHLAAVDVPHEAVDVDEGGVSQNHHRVLAGVLLRNKKIFSHINKAFITHEQKACWEGRLKNLRFWS